MRGVLTLITLLFYIRSYLYLERGPLRGGAYVCRSLLIWDKSVISVRGPFESITMRVCPLHLRCKNGVRRCKESVRDRPKAAATVAPGREPRGAQ